MLHNLKNFNLPEIEEKVLNFWKKNKIFEKSVAFRQNRGGKPFRFFEGPPSANGQPGIHHVLTRSLKDVILRYRTMRGFYVLRRAGWDTHGLPIEISVEKELGIKNKSEIEKFGIAEFNERARMLVWKYKADWEKLTERIGFWLDFEHPYITYDNSYIESLWWIFKEVNKAGYLKKLYKTVPWCPRCQTSLSNHELGQPDVYRKTKDPSVYVKFKVSARGGSASGGKSQRPGPKSNEYLLVWTTTPWTLPANVFIAVNPRLTYTKFSVRDGSLPARLAKATAERAGRQGVSPGKVEFFWSYNPPPKFEGMEISAVEKIAGIKLLGMKYEPLYENKAVNKKNSYQIVAGDFVSVEEGTGLVHIAPAFGEDDSKLYKSLVSKNSTSSHSIPATINDEGKMLKGFPGEGKFIKAADRDVSSDLLKRGLLYREEIIEHEYPFCWRCSTPLIYFARLTWFIEMSRLRDELMKANDKINWIPSHIKEGRFGEWLKEVKDWSISRERYWGTPLPIWECENCTHKLVIGSFQELSDCAYYRNRFFMVRHGEAEHNLRGTIASGPENKKTTSHLTKNGVLQTEKISQTLKEKKIDLIITSPYLRARKTAQIIAKKTKAKILIDKRIVDINAGIFNGRSVTDFQKSFSSLEERFSRRPVNGESLTDVRKRMIGFLKDINQKYNGRSIVIVSHGDPLWVLEGAVKNLQGRDLTKIPYLDVGNFKELSFPNQPYNNEGIVDCHRPFVDELVLKCEKCKRMMRRVKDVADVWFDSGAMPFAQWHYPFENKELVDKNGQFPADYIVEGIDQTRGWFYTLLAISVLLNKGAPYKNVVVNGLLLDKHGQKMSKSKGNVVDPWAMIQKYGVDVVRWYFYNAGDLSESRRFDEADLLKVFRKLHLIFYNSFVFLKTYAGSGFEEHLFESKKIKNILDRWILSRWQNAVSVITKKLDNYEIGQAARCIEEFLDDLSHWYIRRSRKRFSSPESKEDFASGFSTLTHILIELSKVVAPFCPFLSEAAYLSLTRKGKQNLSVHLADWPKADRKLLDKKLLATVKGVRDLASQALALRAEAGIKVRQPLSALKISARGGSAFGGKNILSIIRTNKELLNMLQDEINVKEIIFDSRINNSLELDTTITPELYAEGMIRELARIVQKARQDAGYKISDQIHLLIKGPKEIGSIVKEQLAEFKKLVKARQVDFYALGENIKIKFDLELETKIGEANLFLGIRKLT